MAFHRSLVFQVMPTFKSRLSNKGLFSEEDLNKALKGVLTNELSFRKASIVYSRVSQPESADSFESSEGFNESASTSTSFKITSTSFNDKTL